MRYFILLIIIASLGLITYGYSLDNSLTETANKFKGSGTIGLFLIAMPLFLYSERKGKNFKDYMLTEENVRKMQGKPPKEPEES